MSKAVDTGLSIIREFEGLSLVAYPDPVRGWVLPTIGWGTTRYADGTPVRRWDTITRERADAELRQHVERTILPALQRIPRWSEMHPRMQGALMSFAYNLGAGFFGAAGFDTITRKLKAGDWDTMRAAFVLYVNPGSSVEVGLRRRREREADEWEAGLRELRGGSAEVRLAVPYFRQLDSQVDGQGPRMCFSSSCAMLVGRLRPGALQGSNADDDYLRTVLRFGDSTDPAAQVRALREYGIDAARRTNLGWHDLDQQLAIGRPIPIGILHHGPVSAPTGGGHWIVVVGRTADRSAYLVHDPYGDLDLVGGSYDTSASGRFLMYSKKNLGPRWMAEGPGSGWGIIVSRVVA